MVTAILLTFVLASALYLGGLGVVLFIAGRRLAEHLKGDAEAVAAVTRHVMIPLLGRKGKPAPAGEPESAPVVKKTKGTLV
jgi:hypothetical protein